MWKRTYSSELSAFGGVLSSETSLVNDFWVDCAECNDQYHLEEVHDRLARLRSGSVLLVPDTYKGLKNFRLMHQMCDWDGDAYQKFLSELVYLYSIDDLLELCCLFGHVEWKLSKMTSKCKYFFEIYRTCYSDKFDKKCSRVRINSDLSKDLLDHIRDAIEMITLESNSCKQKEFLLRSDFEYLTKNCLNVTKAFL